MKYIYLPIIIAIAFVSSIAGCGKQIDKMPPRTISVQGDAQVPVVPDKVILSLGIETKDKVLDAAKTQNDEIIKRVMAIIATYKIAPKDVKTSRVNIEPQYKRDEEWGGDTDVFLGYNVSQDIDVTLEKISEYDGFLRDVLKAGINKLDNVNFEIKDRSKYEKEARRLAVKKATEKAEELAKSLNVKVGKAVHVRDGCNSRNDDSSSVSYYTGSPMGATVVTISKGNKVVWSCVAIDFELK